jgi:phosphoserine phosphatase
MDGTLLKGTTASLQIARYLGCAEELAGLEARFAAADGVGSLRTRSVSRVADREWKPPTIQGGQVIRE